MEESTRDVEVISAEEATLIPVEANLEIPPLFQMRRTDPTNRVAECWVHAVTPQGERLEQHWRVSVPEPWELPGPFDQDVWVAMQTLVNRKGGMREDGRVFFSMYELLEIMGKPANGRNYEDLKNSLLRLSATHIYSGKAFYSKDTDTYEDRGFGLWDVHFRKRVVKNSGVELERHELEFHSLVRRSFQAGYLKALDADFYYSLSSRYAKRLYRLIDRKRQGNFSWTVSFERLRQLLPLPNSYKSPSKVKDVLKPAHRELRERGFLGEIAFEKGKVPKYRYRINQNFARARRLQELPQPALFTSGGSGGASFEESRSEAEVLRRLRAKGVWPNVAPKLVARGVDICLEALAALPYQVGVEDEGAWLKWAIETGGFEVPEAKRAKDASAAFKAYARSGRKQEKPVPAPPDADPEAAKLWDEVLDEVAEEINSPSLKMWFEGSIPTSVESGSLALSVPNSFAEEYIRTRFKPLIEGSLRERLSKEASLHIAVYGE